MKNFKKIWNYFEPIFAKHQNYFFGFAIAFLIGNIGANIMAPIFYKKIIDEATNQVSSQIFTIDGLLPILFQLGAVLVIASVGRRLGSYLLSKFENNASSEVHNYSFEKISLQTYYFFTNNFIGTLSGKVNRLARNFRSIIQTIYFGFVLLFFDIVLTIIVLFNQNVQLGIAFSVFLIIFVLFSFLFIKKQSRLDTVRAQKGSKRSGVLSDVLTNILNVKIFSSRKNEQEYYGEAVQELKTAQLNTWLFQDRIRLYKNILFIFFEIGIMVVALYLFVSQKITLGTLALVQIYTTVLIANAWNLNRALTSFIEEISDTADAIDIVTTEIKVSDQEITEESKMFYGKIDFNNVSFTYPEGEHIFENFSLHIPAGQTVGLVGKSGSGKTTITKLLLRFFDVDAGHISIDSQLLKSVTHSDLRSSISYIPQESILFHRSIYQNIKYGNMNASREEVISAAEFAHADEFISNFADKYETTVGERGVKLSGGQRQRVAIARAMLKKEAPILVMDEATSSLDSISEKYIQESFEKLSENRTTIVIAHRLSTIQKMDRIIVMDKGQIIEDGTHDELLANNGHYSELWNSQVNGFISE